MELAQMFRGRGFDVTSAHARMKKLMDAEGLEYAPSPRIYNSRLAQELGAWAEARGVGAVQEALYRAYFVDQVNLADVDALVEIAARLGLPREEARHALVERTMRESVDADWAAARDLGITGVPTYVAGERGVVGAQPYDVLVKLAELAGATRRSGP